MTDKPTPTDAELKAMWQLHAADIGGIFYYARAVLAKWGIPAGAGEPFGYFHQLLNHEGKGNGIWLGAAERKVVEQAHTPGETSEEIVALYTSPQPIQAQAGAVESAEFGQFLSDVLTAAGLVTHGKQCKALGERLADMCVKLRHHGVKGGQHGTDET